jgi:hypothetical protein
MANREQLVLAKMAEIRAKREAASIEEEAIRRLREENTRLKKEKKKKEIKSLDSLLREKHEKKLRLAEENNQKIEALLTQLAEFEVFPPFTDISSLILFPDLSDDMAPIHLYTRLSKLHSELRLKILHFWRSIPKNDTSICLLKEYLNKLEHYTNTPILQLVQRFNYLHSYLYEPSIFGGPGCVRNVPDRDVRLKELWESREWILSRFNTDKLYEWKRDEDVRTYKSGQQMFPHSSADDDIFNYIRRIPHEQLLTMTK